MKKSKSAQLLPKKVKKKMQRSEDHEYVKSIMDAKQEKEEWAQCGYDAYIPNYETMRYEIWDMSTVEEWKAKGNETL